MQLTLTFADGTETTVPFSTASTLQVSTDDAIKGSWTSVQSLALTDDPVEVVDGPAQVVIDTTAGVVADAAPVVPDATSSDAQNVTVLPDGTQITGTGTSNPSVTTVTDSTQDASGTVPEPQPVDESGAPIVPPDAITDVPPEPTDTTPEVVTDLADIPGTPENDAAQAEADAQPTTVGEALAAADAAAAPTEPVDTAPPAQVDTPAPDAVVAAANDAVDVAVAGSAPDPSAHVAQAILDVDAALAQWPDDPRLADAKQQLADLAADLSAELG